MFETDKIAVLMATYNGEAYIDAQIDSLLAQAWAAAIESSSAGDRNVRIDERFGISAQAKNLEHMTIASRLCRAGDY